MNLPESRSAAAHPQHCDPRVTPSIEEIRETPRFAVACAAVRGLLGIATMLSRRVAAPVFGFVLAMATVAFAPRDASACGGCFHAEPPPGSTQSASVVTDHRMVLSLGTSSTTLWDQIQYAGDPADFAWVLPTRGKVVVGVGSSSFIDALDQATTPLIHSPAITCNNTGGGVGGGSSNGGCGCGSSAEDSAGFSPTGDLGVDGSVADTGVVITSQTTVGPYDVVQIHGTDEVSIVKWLRDHSYVIPKEIEPILQKYVTEGFDFTAVRLRPGKGVQAMRPIRVTFPGRYPSLPLRMVAAGVGASVGVKLFVIGDGRWHTKNFPTFSVDPASLTWDFSTQRSNYTKQRDDAAAGFSGRAFALESSIDFLARNVPPPDRDDDAGPLDTGVPVDSGSDSSTDTAIDTAIAPDTSTTDADAISSDASDVSDVSDVSDAADASDASDVSDVASSDGAIPASDTGKPGADVGPSGDPSATDRDIAFGTFASRRVTRLRADLPASALVEDLELEADSAQQTVPVDYAVKKFTNDTAVCGPGGATLVPSAGGSLLRLDGNAGCSTSKDESEPSPMRTPLLLAGAVIGLSLVRRVVRRKK